MKRPFFFIFLAALFVISCSVKLPDTVQHVEGNARIYPDYTGIVVPWNIAPLNFDILEEGDDFMVSVYGSGERRLTARGKSIQWNLKAWKQLLGENKGDTLYVDIYVRRGKQWYKYPVIKNYVADEEIDSYISYRLIEPSYSVYEYMSINQRNLTNFDERVIYSNTLLGTGEEGQCINCHAYQDYNRTNSMQFHIRQHKGGTLIGTSGRLKKVNLKTAHTISAGVYPAWHPTMNLIAYSTNHTEQHFHKANKEKVEVMDSRSDVILYDVDRNEVRVVADSSDELETFPAWSPDGRFLYYASARYPDGINPDDDLKHGYQEFRYDLYRKAFDPKTYNFSVADTVLKASAMHKSASFPRISPDGRYLLFALGDYGNFHIWHKSSDLYVMDLENNEAIPLTEANSPDAESYHSWSSNGSWIIFSSRRDDGSYTRPYITRFKDGKASKAFVVPQKNPGFYASLFKSFNVPEFMVQPVAITKRQLIKTNKTQAVDAKYVGAETAADSRESAKEDFYD